MRNQYCLRFLAQEIKFSIYYFTLREMLNLRKGGGEQCLGEIKIELQEVTGQNELLEKRTEVGRIKLLIVMVFAL